MTCASVMASHDDPPRDTEVESRKSNIRAIGVPSIGPNFLQASPGKSNEIYSRSSSRSSKLTSHKLRDASKGPKVMDEHFLYFRAWFFKCRPLIQHVLDPWLVERSRNGRWVLKKWAPWTCHRRHHLPYHQSGHRLTDAVSMMKNVFEMQVTYSLFQLDYSGPLFTTSWYSRISKLYTVTENL